LTNFPKSSSVGVLLQDEDDGYFTKQEKQLYELAGLARNDGSSDGADDGAPIRWQKGAQIGQGAFGKVFLGLDKNSGASACEPTSWE
jgi:hypothetical protein